MKEAAARVLALDFGDVQASRPRQVAIGWLRAAMAEADAIVRLTQSGHGYAAAPNRRSFFEIALRLQWLEGLDDRDGAIDSMVEEEQRQARAHTGHLAEMGMSSLPDFSDLEAVVIEATRDKSVAAQAKQFTAAAKAIESSALGLFRAWREETQYTHATVKLGLSYAPAQAGRFIDGTPQIMDPDFDTLLTVAIFAMAMESVDLARRGSNYRNAKTDRSRQRTSRRIHKELVRHLAIGGGVHLSIATDVVLGVDGEPVDLRWKSARRLAENAAVLLAQLDGEKEVLNIDADLGTAESVRDEESANEIISG